MSLKNFKKEFEEKKIDKWKFIDSMYGIHSMLFDYSEYIKSTSISKIEINDGKVIMTFRDSGVKFLCETNDKRIAPLEALNFGSYEQEELSMQLLLIDDDFNVLDIGGNYGWYALHVAKKKPSVTIYSFEPIPATYKYLDENISLNSLTNVFIVNQGLSDSKGSFKFFFDPSLSVNASLQNLTGSGQIEEVICVVDTIDNYCTSNNVRVDFIKCDVEGAELLAFKGGINTIKKDLPIVFSEMLKKMDTKI